MDEDRVAEIRADAVRQQEDAIREYGEEEVDVLSEEQIDFALSAATFLIAHRGLDRLLYAKDQFAEFELASRLAAPEAELNVPREPRK